MKLIPLVRVLTDAGYGCRRDASKLIDAGMVEVNGRIASSFTERVDPETDSVVVVGRKVSNSAARRVYFAMNKPAGYLSSTEDDRGRPTVMDLLPESMRCEGLHPAGRLDEDTTGLLILTNDGQFTYELTHPRYEHDKEYYVATTGRLTAADIRELERGVEVEEEVTWPARVVPLEGQSPYSYSITIHEGRKRQVRQMFAAVGQQVALLKRVRIGDLRLGDLPEGTVRELTAAELEALMRKRPSRPTSTASHGKGSKQTVHESRPPRGLRPFTGPKLMRGWRSTEALTGGEDAPVAFPGQPSQRRLYIEGAKRQYAGTVGGRSERIHERRPSRQAAERPYRRPVGERPERVYERRPGGQTAERPYRRPVGERPERVYEGRPGGQTAERPYRRPVGERSERVYERRPGGQTAERPYRRPVGERSERVYERRPGGQTAERPYRRPVGERSERAYERRPTKPSLRARFSRYSSEASAERQEPGAQPEKRYGGRTNRQRSDRSKTVYAMEHGQGGRATGRKERRPSDRVRMPDDTSPQQPRPARQGDARPQSTSPAAGRRRPSAPR